MIHFHNKQTRTAEYFSSLFSFRKIALFFLYFFSYMTCLYASVLEVKMHYSFGLNDSNIYLYISEDQYEISQNENELLIKFNRGIQVKGTESLYKNGSKWLTDFIISYDSILFEFQSNIDSIEVNPNSKELEIVLKKIQTVANYAPVSIVLELTQIRLFIQKGDLNKAEELNNQLLILNPESVELLINQADIENRKGNWHYAVNLIQQAESISPDHEEISRFKLEILNEHLPFLKVELGNSRNRKSNQERIFQSSS